MFYEVVKKDMLETYLSGHEDYELYKNKVPVLSNHQTTINPPERYVGEPQLARSVETSTYTYKQPKDL